MKEGIIIRGKTGQHPATPAKKSGSPNRVFFKARCEICRAEPGFHGRIVRGPDFETSVPGRRFEFLARAFITCGSQYCRHRAELGGHTGGPPLRLFDRPLADGEAARRRAADDIGGIWEY